MRSGRPRATARVYAARTVRVIEIRLLEVDFWHNALELRLEEGQGSIDEVSEVGEELGVHLKEYTHGNREFDGDSNNKP